MTVEDIILQKGRRGMDLLRPLLPEDFCRAAARRLYTLPRGRVLLLTGFYVAGHPESDGPAGTLCLARALAALGFAPLILADDHCQGLFEEMECRLFPAGPVDAEVLLDELSPVGVLSLERCGRNAAGDYTNMRGRSIAAHTAALDSLLPAARARGIFTLGVGDGGNEAGMGALAGDIREKLSLEPSVVEADALVLATVSNWGGYGLAACLGRLSGRSLLAGDWLPDYLEKTAALGVVDGVSGLPTPTVDGYPAGTENTVYEQLRAWAGAER